MTEALFWRMEAERHTQAAPEVTRQCPADGEYLMPCCGLTPFEARGDRITLDAALVTCSIEPVGFGARGNGGQENGK